jgi:glycosyltransferase involved in cell wall biosynthesis
LKKLLIDVNSIVPFLVSGKTTGIGRTTLELVFALEKISDQIPFEINLYSQNLKGVGGKQLATSFTGRHVYLPNRNNVNKFLGNWPVKETLVPYDLLHIPNNFAYVNKPGKTIVTLHDALFMRMDEKGFDHLGMRQYVPGLMRKCKGIITCSQSSKKDIVETMDINPGKIDVIYWGIMHDIFYPNANKELIKKNIAMHHAIERPYFLSVSCNTERKNTHKLVEAYLSLCKHHPQNDLVLVWNNPPAFILEMVSQAKMNNRVHFIPDISDAGLAQLYNGATAFVFPSSYEGFGLPVLEAMACGTPVITCNNSSLPEIGGDAAIYMDDASTETILKELQNFENKIYDITHLISKGTAQAAQFRWEKTAADYLKLYSNHLGI